MKPLISIDGYDFPEPATYEATTATIVDSARNVKGYVIGSVIRSDVAKVSVSWKFLTAEQWATLLTMFAESFYNDVTFLNQTSNQWETRSMYVSDRKGKIWRRHPDTGEVMGYVDCSLSLVEV